MSFYLRDLKQGDKGGMWKERGSDRDMNRNQVTMSVYLWLCVYYIESVSEKEEREIMCLSVCVCV